MERTTELERAVLALVPAPTPVAQTQRVPLPAIAFVDLETTGLDSRRHEIVEVAVIRVEARSLEVISACEVRVQPTRLQDAEAEALAVSGFSLADWAQASSLEVAMARISPLLEGALVAGHNVGFDWAFLEAGFRHVGLRCPEVDHHRLDTASLAWPSSTRQQPPIAGPGLVQEGSLR
jgi:DNA polymerase-3 subunit epsilon